MEFAGEFETHMTLRIDRPEQMPALQAWAREHRLKCLHIVLARGQSISQPMLTRHGRGLLSTELTAAAEIKTALETNGFPVTRIKIEAAPDNQDVPVLPTETWNHPEDHYFEHHIKLLLDAGVSLDPIEAVALQHGAHLSRNSLKSRPDGRQERFVTQRARVGRNISRGKLADLLHALTNGGYTILETEEEFVVYDSNIALDAGWIEP